MVFGLIKRNGHVKAMPIAAHDQASVMQQIDAHSREGSLYYADQWQAYAKACPRFCVNGPKAGKQ
jgi:transposase